MPIHSPNFSFLAQQDPLLVDLAAHAERYVFDDPNVCLIKLRQFSEYLARYIAVEIGINLTNITDQASLLGTLRSRNAIPFEVYELFHGLRKSGNDAVHQNMGDQSQALHHLKMARQIAIWFKRSYGNSPNFKPVPFVVPLDPKQPGEDLKHELDTLRKEVAVQQLAAEHAKQTKQAEAELRQQAELKAQKAYADLEAALALAVETESRLQQEKQSFEAKLLELQTATKEASAEEVAVKIDQAQKASTLLDLDEAATRKIIDQQLRDHGWEADTTNLSYQAGTRPQKGKNLAIAEWPTQNGPMDYVLFIGLQPVAAIEAKRAIRDVSGAIEQAKRYSRGFKPLETFDKNGGPWDKYQVPFMFATNSRPYLKQLETKSGIWFLDGRKHTNHSRALDGWYTPEGLEALLKQDLDLADKLLKDEPPDPLGLRYYQNQAITEVEAGIAEGKRQLLVAMATGTGKTKTCIGLLYRLIKTNRFKRVLFLVDRTSLGEQAENAFKDFRIDNTQTFTDIYEISGISDVKPEPDTKVHFATIQGMIKRLLFTGDDDKPIPVDQYDCIIVDECHRGYSLDKELSETEFEFRNEQDYISKYRRALEHFDAVKIGLTATPALHTVQIFGSAIYEYSYRQAVIDGYLIDHEPPLQITTKLAKDGITWEKGAVVEYLVKETGEVTKEIAPDEIRIDIEGFNKLVITENFNKVVCQTLAEHIDPSLPGKTIIYCVTDDHADMVVKELKLALVRVYGSLEDDAVKKITGAADKPSQLIRNFKNERLPSIAVTVDLLTTGIDVPSVSNIVFLRRVASRILYNQMLGRATRLCPEIGKETFRIFDAVKLYEAMQDHSDMKPVVANPKTTFEQLADELKAHNKPKIEKLILDQFKTKLHRKKRHLEHSANQEALQALTNQEPYAFWEQLKKTKAADLRQLFTQYPGLASFLDKLGNPNPTTQLLSSHPDQLIDTKYGYGKAKKPEDYIESFRTFIKDHQLSMPAIMIVLQRPRDLTRQQLRELKVALDQAGFTETILQTAWRETTNQNIAATIIGYIRSAIINEPLVPYQQRVQKAMTKILASQPWTPPQRRWLERIGKQLELETIIDKDFFNQGQFKSEGGYTRLDKIFQGKLETIMTDIADTIWQTAA